MKHLSKIWLEKKKKKKKKWQVKVKFRSKVMPVLVFYFWRHLWQFIRTAAIFLYNSSLSRNARFFKSDQAFNQSWKLVQMENTCFKTLKLQKFCKIFGERCETGGPFMMSFSKVLQNNFKIIYRDQTTRNYCTSSHLNF